jgi:hypothetical protein
MGEECIDSVIGQETQLAVLGTTERVLYTVQDIRNVLHYDVLQKEPESYGSVKKLREAGGIHRPELDGTEWKHVEYAGSYTIVQYLGSVNPYSYPCRRVRASDLWCRRRRDVTASTLHTSAVRTSTSTPGTSARIKFFISSRASPERARIGTKAPACAYCSAVSRPTPRDAPVTRTTFPP